jgi:pSer/pThr/pTyr-binding forkhead associated (FHA) protein
MNVKMLVVHGRPVGKSLLFGPGEYYLGRGPECHVRFNSDWVSRQHCLLRIGADSARLRDLGSRNGTLVNGQLLHEERILADGDQVQIGPVGFEVRLEIPALIDPPSPTPTKPTLLPGETDRDEPPTDSTAHHPFLGDY